MTQQRLQKILGQAGYGSRREIEKWIEAGCLQINQRVAKLGDSATENDVLHLNGRLIPNPLLKAATQAIRILLYHKPVGEISSKRDPLHTKTVFDHLPRLKEGRWVQVGRLDINTAGLLLFTNNGDVAHQLMHPRFNLEREYAVRVQGEVQDSMIQNLLKGVELEDGMAKFKRIDFRGGESSNVWYHVVLTEGRHREVRRLWESQNLRVSRLIRVRYGSFTLPRSLPRGKFLELSEDAVTRYLNAFHAQKKGSKA
ncbi:MAG: pseudouridine synthase [Legionella sp.]|nr:pseudouridine synthase [Legionella sp.]